jgi:hypothetical protein
VSIIDSTITNTPIGILTNERSGNASVKPPNIVLDNLNTNNVPVIVQTDKGKVLLPGSGGGTVVSLWATGFRQIGGRGSMQTGYLSSMNKPQPLMKDGKIFAKSRPQYETLPQSSFAVATHPDFGIANDGSGDQTDKINKFLNSALGSGRVAYFPAGIYQVQGTVFVPPGSRIQGASWSQVWELTQRIGRNMLTLLALK